jgi:hypothetical protein
MAEYPVRWKILKIEQDGDILYKVFASWWDSWRLNSGCVKVEDSGDSFILHGYSGSVYVLRKDGEGTASAYTESVLNNIIQQMVAGGVDVETVTIQELVDHLENAEENKNVQ